MDFELQLEQKMALDGWRRLVEKEVLPIARNFQDKPYEKDAALEVMRIMAPFGVGSGWVPEAGGGAGLDFLTSGMLFEELAKVSPDTAGVAWVAEGAALKIYENGSDAIKQRYLPKLVSGEMIGCSAISEPNVGSNIREITTKAVRDGQYFRISGEKMWTSNATIADLITVVARTGEDEFSMFLVDREEHGFQARNIEKLGIKGWPMCQVYFDDVVVPEENLLGVIGGGLKEAMKGFARSRCFVSCLALGIAQSALDAAVQYAKERVQFGRAIAGHQLVQAMLADMATEIAASRLLVYRALSKMDSGVRCDVEASMAKLFTTEAAQRVTSQAVQVMGACGLTTEFPAERHFRNARMLTIPDGTTQINQLIIGRQLTGVAAFS